MVRNVYHTIVFKYLYPLTIYERNHLWVRRLYSKFSYWYSQNYHPDQTGYYEKLGILKALDPLLFKRYKTVSACVFKMKVVYPHLDEYTKQLRRINYILSEHIAVENNWCKYDWVEVSLHEFLITKEGIHLDPVNAIASFKRSAITFLQHYALIRDAQIDDDGHNARILAKFQNSILDLANHLLRYSQNDRSQ